MKYILEAISPVHIGTGDIISPIEYVINDKFYRVDMDGLFKDKAFDNDKFIESAKGGQLYLGKFAPDLGKKYTRYSLGISSSTKMSLQESIGSRSSEVREFIKTGDVVYIPGSSIKGAIRTSILWQTLKNPQILQNAKDIIRKQGRVKPKEADDKIEKRIFGRNPNYDLLRSLQVSDSKTTAINDLELSRVVILSINQNGHGWKAFKGRRSFIVPNSDDATPIFIESLKPKRMLMGAIKIDEWLLHGENEEIPKQLEFNGKQNLVEDIPKNCNEFARNFIEYEIKFFERCNDMGKLREVTEFYKALEEEFKILPKNEFLLHISWGSGWHGMTVGELFDINMLRETFDLGKNIKRSFCRKCNSQLVKERPDDRFYDYCQNCQRHLRKNEQYQKIVKLIWPFPKTRKIVFEDGKPKYPLGWIKVKVED